MSETVRVYVNAVPVDAPTGGQPIDAVRVWDSAMAERVAAGERAITDSRGLPIEEGAIVYHGAIFRVVAVRSRTNAADVQEPDA